MVVFSATQSAQQNISLNMGTTAVLVVDMVHDFCHPEGAMCLPGAERLYPVQNNLIQSARDAGMMIGWVVDAHRSGVRLRTRSRFIART
ncbi:MAG: isochorismatase family protein [Pseudomonadales bacterium]